MKKILPVALLAVSLTAAGCSSIQGREKQTGGAVLGGVGGAVAGAQFGSGTGQLVATAAGALLGAFVGSEIGSSLDRADRIEAEQTAQTALESNQIGTQAAWSNPDTGHSGTFTPTKTYQRNDGQYCREYETTVNVDGKVERAYGEACRQPDGTWKVVS